MAVTVGRHVRRPQGHVRTRIQESHAVHLEEEVDLGRVVVVLALLVVDVLGVLVYALQLLERQLVMRGEGQVIVGRHTAPMLSGINTEI